MDGAGETGGRATRRRVLQATGTALAVGGLAKSTAAQASGPTVYVGGFDNLYAVDAATGEERWRFETGHPFVGSSPTVADGTVYVGSWDNSLYAMGAASGEEQWRFQTDGHLSSPTVVNGTVYIRSNDDNLYALDAVSGEEQWRFSTVGTTFSSPTVVDGTVYLSGGPLLFAVGAASGKEQWRFNPDRGIQSSPTVVDSTVYVGVGDGNLYAVDAATGEEQWRFQTGDWVGSSPTVVDSTVYVGSHDDNLYAVDAASGEEQWRFETGNVVDSSPTVADGTVYVGSQDANLYAVDTASGEEQWRFEIDRPTSTSPTVADGTVYASEVDLYALDAGSGEEQWRFETDNAAESSPTVVTSPKGGNSVGSRVRLGTLGHHGKWRYAGQDIDVVSEDSSESGGGGTATPSAEGTESGGGGTATPSAEGTKSGGRDVTPSDPASSDEFREPFGDTEVLSLERVLVGSTGVATLVGGYALHRFRHDKSSGRVTHGSGDANADAIEAKSPSRSPPAQSNQPDESNAAPNPEPPQNLQDASNEPGETATTGSGATTDGDATADQRDSSDDSEPPPADALQEALTALQSDVDDVDGLLDDGELNAAERRLDAIAEECADLQHRAEEHGLEDVMDDAVVLLEACSDRRARIETGRRRREVSDRVTEADRYREQAAAALSGGRSPPDVDQIEEAIEDYETALDVYGAAISVAADHGLDTGGIEEQREAVDDELARARARRDAQEGLNTVRETAAEARSALESGDAATATDRISTARRTLEAVKSTVAEHGFDQLADAVASLREDLDALAEGVDDEQARQRVEALVSDSDDARRRASDLVQGAAAIPDPARIEEALESYEDALEGYEDALDLAAELDVETADIEADREAVSTAIEREETRRGLAAECAELEASLEDAETALREGRLDDAARQGASLDDRLTAVSERAREEGFDEMLEATRSLQKRYDDLTAAIEAERARREVDELLASARDHRDRGDEAFEADGVPPTDAIDAATERYREATQSLQEAIDVAAEHETIDAADIEGRLDEVESRLATLDQQRQLRDRYSALDARLAETVDAVADDADRAELTSATEALEAVANELADLAATATAEGFETFAGTVEGRRADCEDALAEIEARLDRLRVPATIPGGPALTLEYDRIETGAIAGRGGDADVYEATVETGPGATTIALKQPRFAGTLHTEVVDRFINEAEVWDQLDAHDHIVDVIDWGTDPLPWIALEYMDGGTLGDRIGEQSLEEALWIARTVADSVWHAHRRGITHLDIKPENVLFRTTEAGLWDVPKVSDWGLAKLMLEHSKSLEGLTPQYAAPEQVDPEEFGHTDQQTDVYQLGAVLYELFTGEPVFSGQPARIVRQITDEQVVPPTEVEPALPPQLDDVLLRTLAKDREDRYEDIIYLRDALRDLEKSL